MHCSAGVCVPGRPWDSAQVAYDRLAVTLHSFQAVWFGHRFAGQVVLIYPVYGVMITENTSEFAFSTLLALWAASVLVAEIPSGTLADRTSRVRLIGLAGVLKGAGFLTWLVLPNYWGYLLGFALWGVGSTLKSGTEQALLHDTLHFLGRPEWFERIHGRGGAASSSGTIVAFVAGGYLAEHAGFALPLALSALGPWAAAAIAWVGLKDVPRSSSEGRPLAHPHAEGSFGEGKPLAHPQAEDSSSEGRPLALPQAEGSSSEGKPLALPQAEGYDERPEGEERYLDTLRAGVREAVGRPLVLRAVLMSASVVCIWGVMDEFLPVFLTEKGNISLADIGIIYAACSAANIVALALAHRLPARTPRRVGVVFGVAAVPLALSVAAPGYIGAVLLVLSFGINGAASVLLDGQLQRAIRGHARATVTSVAGTGSEITGIGLYLAAGATAEVASWHAATAMFAALALMLAAIFAAKPIRPSPN